MPAYKCKIASTDGEIVEEGRHDDLVNKTGGIYNEMWKTQVNSFLNE